MSILAKDKPVGNIKFGIGLDGFDQTLNTLDKVNKSLKVSESNLKTMVSTFDKASTSAEDLAKKQDALTEITELQSKRIDILNDRRGKYIESYGKESKQVASVTTQLNKATTQYNGYAKQLKDTTQSQIIAASGVDKYSKAIKDNEKSLADEVKALKEAGDKSGELEARQKGLTKQADLTEKAIEAQKDAIAKLGKEFGESSDEVKKAEAYLESLQRTSKNTGTRLQGVETALSKLANEADDVTKEVSKAGDAIKDAGDKGDSAAGGFDAGTAALGGLVGGLAASVSTKALDVIIDSLGQVAESFESVRKAQTDLQNQTYFDKTQVKELTVYANDLVKANLADTFDDATESILATYQALGGSVQDPLQLTDIATRAQGIATTWDTDINEVVRGASGLSKSFGISVQAAFDYLAAGAKGGLNYSQELFDNIAEYAPQFKQNGYNAQQMFQVLANGTDAGAYNLDKVNDLVKEFGVRVSDGTIKKNIEGFGGEFTKLYSEFEKGNITQQALLAGYSNLIGEVEDGTKQATLVSEIFGSVGEDNGVKVVTSLGQVRDEYYNVDGMVTSLNNNISNTTAWEALKDGIAGVVGEIGIWAQDFGQDGTVNAIQKFFNEDIYTWKENINSFVTDIKNRLSELDPNLETFSSALDNMGGIVNTIVDVALYNMNKGFETLGDFFNNTVLPTIIPLLDQWSDRLERIAGYFGGTAEASDKFKIAIDVMWELIKVRLELMFKLFTTTFNAISTLIEIIAAGIAGTWDTFTAILDGDWAKAWESIKETVGNVFNAIWIAIKDTWVGKLLTAIGTFLTDSTKAFLEWTSGVGEDVSEFLDNMVKWFTELPDRIAEAFSSGGEVIKKAFNGVFNGVIKAISKPVNGIIGGANWVLNKLGADEITPWTPEYFYENGTPNGGHPGGTMMVNDGAGAEMVIAPSGQAFIPKGKNVVMNAPKGTHVLTAEETAQVTGNKRPKYRYAKGTGFFDGLKNSIGDIFDYATDPAKLVSKVFDGLGVLDGLTKFPLEVGSAILKKATSSMIDKVKGLFESGGNLDLSTGNLGVYKYLADVAQQVMSKFGGFVATSGYRPGDPHDHGKRNAIDIAIPGVTNGSSQYAAAGRYAFEKFASKVGYVIANNKVADRSGKSGTGIHDNWVNWAAGGHMDHVHISGVKDPQAASGSGENFTGNVGAYASIAKRALAMTGQYSTANLNALLNQMRTESNGNARAINNWDINAKNGTPSKGLMQVIDPTFREYAMKGYNSNIYDPLSNILASIRYTLSRYGSLTAGWWGVGYENGGLITQQHLAMVGEKNRPEMVIPLHSSKRSRAMELLAQAQEKLGVTNQATVVSSDDGSGALIAQLIQQQTRTNLLLEALLSKDSDVYLDGTKVTAIVAPNVKSYNERANSIASRRQGRFA